MKNEDERTMKKLRVVGLGNFLVSTVCYIQLGQPNWCYTWYGYIVVYFLCFGMMNEWGVIDDMYILPPTCVWCEFYQICENCVNSITCKITMHHVF